MIAESASELHNFTTPNGRAFKTVRQGPLEQVPSLLSWTCNGRHICTWRFAISARLHLVSLYLSVQARDNSRALLPRTTRLTSATRSALSLQTQHMLQQLAADSEARAQKCHSQVGLRILGVPRLTDSETTTGELYDDAEFYLALLKVKLDFQGPATLSHFFIEHQNFDNSKPASLNLAIWSPYFLKKLFASRIVVCFLGGTVVSLELIRSISVMSALSQRSLTCCSFSKSEE